MAVPYMAEEGFRKLKEELAYMESVQRPRYPAKLLKQGIKKETFLKMCQATMPPKKRKECWEKLKLHKRKHLDLASGAA